MSASEWLVISEHALLEPKEQGSWVRAFCHIHGGDHQRSLSISRASGFGQCHMCHAQVVVQEWNPKAAGNIQRSAGRVSEGRIFVRDPTYLARAAGAPKQAPTIEKWQVEEVSFLRSLQESMQSRLTDERARDYLTGRGVQGDTALHLGVGYIPDVALTGKYALLARWSDHIIFPVQSPTGGMQYVGRSLKLWLPGMDETEQKQRLEAREKAYREQAKAAKDRGDRREEKRLNAQAGLYHRWCKTHCGGWFNFQALGAALEGSRHVLFCEGAFDALSLMEAGMNHVVAIIGTALDVDWIPAKIAHVTLAFDGDESGILRSAHLREDLYEHGYDVMICHAPQDGRGKDWSERYRLHGRDGLAPLLAVQAHDMPVENGAMSLVETSTVFSNVAPNSDDTELSLICSVCGAEVEFYSDDGIAYCNLHYEQLRASVVNSRACSALSDEQRFTEIVEQLAAAFGNAGVGAITAYDGSKHTEVSDLPRPVGEACRFCKKAGKTSQWVWNGDEWMCDICYSPAYGPAMLQKDLVSQVQRDAWQKERADLLNAEYEKMVAQTAVELAEIKTQYREKYGLSVVPAQVTDRAPIALPPLRGHRCTNRFESNYAQPHDEPGELLTADSAGNVWCEQCGTQRELMNYGHAHGWPVVLNGKGVTIQQGYLAWEKFARTSGHEGVVRVANQLISEVGQ